MSVSRRLRWGVMLLVGAAYVLTSPGRIDSIDGQFRFDVAQSLLSVGLPILQDPSIRDLGMRGLGGHSYIGYEWAPSVVAMPLVWLGGLVADPYGETRRFLFSLAGPILGGLLAAVLLGVFLQLGLSPRRAVGWTLVAAFASLLWPASTTVLDQSQHALWLTLALAAAWRAGRNPAAEERRDRTLLWAAVAGAAFAVLLNYRIVFVVTLPGLFWALGGERGLFAWRRPERRLVARSLMCAAGVVAGLALYAAYNLWRFGEIIMPAVGAFAAAHPQQALNPLRGLLGFFVSPGKALWLYSPTAILGLAGFSGLRRRAPALAVGWAIAATAYVGLVACVPFWHGDWSWGPRYLVPALPLLALAAPFAAEGARGLFRRRAVVGGLIAVSLAVQGLGLAVVHERYFFERGLAIFFWADDPLFYYRNSALFARPGEILSSPSRLAEASGEWFGPTPYRRSLTHFIQGFPDPTQAPSEMRQFPVFYRPRPWPLWLPAIDRGRFSLPVEPRRTTAMFLLLGLWGALWLRRGIGPVVEGAAPLGTARDGAAGRED